MPFIFMSTAALVSGERLQKYVYHKILNEIPEGPYCVVYIHTSVQREVKTAMGCRHCG